MSESIHEDKKVKTEETFEVFDEYFELYIKCAERDCMRKCNKETGDPSFYLIERNPENIFIYNNNCNILLLEAEKVKLSVLPGGYPKKNIIYNYDFFKKGNMLKNMSKKIFCEEITKDKEYIEYRHEYLIREFNRFTESNNLSIFFKLCSNCHRDINVWKREGCTEECKKNQTPELIEYFSHQYCMTNKNNNMVGVILTITEVHRLRVKDCNTVQLFENFNLYYTTVLKNAGKKRYVFYPDNTKNDPEKNIILNKLYYSICYSNVYEYISLSARKKIY